MSKERLIHLNRSASPFPVPHELIKALSGACDVKHLPRVDPILSLELDKLQRNIASYFASRMQQTHEHVWMGSNLLYLVQMLQFALQCPVLCPTPHALFQPLSELLNQHLLPLETQKSDCTVDATLLKQKAKDLGTPFILLCCNPCRISGSVYEEEQLKAIAAIIKASNGYVISDETYRDGQHKTPRPTYSQVAPEHTVAVMDAGEAFGADGWQLSAAVFPSSLKDVCAWARQETVASSSHPSLPIQHALGQAFLLSHGLQQYHTQTHRIFSSLGRIAARKLRGVGLLCTQPMAGHSLLVDASPYASRLAKIGITRDNQLAAFFAKEGAVLVLPASDLGYPEERLSFQLAYVDFDGTRALEAVNVVPIEQTLDEAFISRYCEETLIGVERMCALLSGL